MFPDDLFAAFAGGLVDFLFNGVVALFFSPLTALANELVAFFVSLLPLV